MTTEQLQRQLVYIREKIQQALEQAGRKGETVQLCAASKTQTAQTVEQAAKLDIGLFGENRVQELVEKYAFGAYGSHPVHMIGHLQTNKVRQVVGKAAIIQSVDSTRLLETIAQEASKQNLVQKILLEINIGGEQSKSGIAPEQLPFLLEQAESCNHVQVLGLMAIPPKCQEEKQARQYFSQMYQLFCQAKDHYCTKSKMEILSMGMSGDFPLAILEGSTMVRVGTALFGQRQYP